MELTKQEIEEINLSISFGQRLMEYWDETLKRMIGQMSDNDKIRQYYQSDRSYICDIIGALERGEGIEYLYPIKKRLTVVGQLFFKNEFKRLKDLA